MIYVVEILDQKFIKIGFSKENESARRIAELQTGSPFKINEVFIIDGTLRQEQAIHASMNVAMARCGLPHPPNEWYPGRNPFVQDFIQHLRMGANQGIAFAERYNSSVRQPSVSRGGIDRAPNFKWPKISKKEVVGYGVQQGQL